MAGQDGAAELGNHLNGGLEMHDSASHRHTTSITQVETVRRRVPLHDDLATLEERSSNCDDDLLTEEEQENWLPFMEEQCRLLTTNDASTLDKQLEQLDVSRDVSVRKSTLYCSMPILALLRTHVFRCGMLLVSLFYIAFMSYNIQSLARGSNRVHTKVIRFTALDREMSQPTNMESLRELEVTRHSCPVLPASQLTTNSSITLYFPTAVSLTGWRFIDSSQHRNRSFTKLLLEASRTTEDQLSVVSRPTWHVGFGFVSQQDWPLPSPSKEDQRVEMSFSGPLALSLAQILVPAVIGIHGLVSFGLACNDRILSARTALSVGMTVLCIVSLSVFLVLLGQQQWAAAQCWSPTLAASLMLAPSVVSAPTERFLPSSLALAAVAVAVLLVVNNAMADSLELLAVSHELYLCCVAAGVAIFLWEKRRKLLEAVQVGISEDRARYDAAWQRTLDELYQDESGESAMHELLECVRDCSFGHVKRPTQTIVSVHDRPWSHLKHIFQTPSSLSRTSRTSSTVHTSTTSPGRTPSTAPPARASVNSLDQLYAQAQSCQLVVRSKAKQLLESCGGLVAITARSEGDEVAGQVFKPWAEVQADSELLSLVCWTEIKPTKRAVEKVAHHYHGDVSRLTDVCREMLVFETLSGITKCLRSLESDPEVVLELVRSNLAPHHDAAYSAGFRCVVVKLRIVNKLTETFGVDGHVCEVLLVPLCIASSMSNASHDKYRQLHELRDFQGAARLLSRLSAWSRCSADLNMKSRRSGSGPPASRSLDGLIASLQFQQPPSTTRSNTASTPASRAGAPHMQDFPVVRRAASVPTATADEVNAEESRRSVPDTMPATAPGEAGPGWSRIRSWSRQGGQVGRAESTATAQASIASAARSLTRTASYRPVAAAAKAWRRASSAWTRATSGPATSDGSVKEQEKLSQIGALLALYRRRTTEEPGRLDREVTQIDVAVAHADHVSVFATSFPIAAAMCKPWFFWPVIVIAASHLLSAVSGLARLGSSGRFQASAVRLNPIAAGNAQQQLEARQFWESDEWQFGLLSKGCRVPLNSTAADGFLYHLGEKVDFNGVFVTSSHSATLPRISFAIDALVDDDRWETMTVPLYTIDGFLSWASAAEGHGGSTDVEVSYIPPWFVWMGMPVSSLALAVTWFAVAGCALARRVRWGRPVLLGGFAISAVLWVHSAAGSHVRHQLDNAAAHWGEPAVLVVTVLVVFVREQLLLEAMLLLALSNMVLRVVLAVQAHDTTMAVGLHSVEWVCLLVVTAGLKVVRARAKHSAKKRIEQDMRTYDAAWSALLDDHTHDADLDHIQQLTLSIKANHDTSIPVLQSFWIPQSRRLSRSRHRRGSPRNSLLSRRSCSPSPGRSASPPRGPSACSERPDSLKLSSAVVLQSVAGGEAPLRMSFRQKKSSERAASGFHPRTPPPSTANQASPHQGFGRAATEVGPIRARKVLRRGGSFRSMGHSPVVSQAGGRSDAAGVASSASVEEADERAQRSPSSLSGWRPQSVGASPLAVRAMEQHLTAPRLAPRVLSAEPEGLNDLALPSPLFSAAPAAVEREVSPSQQELRPFASLPAKLGSPADANHADGAGGEGGEGVGLPEITAELLQMNTATPKADESASNPSSAPSPLGAAGPSAWTAPSPPSTLSSSEIRERFLGWRSDSATGRGSAMPRTTSDGQQSNATQRRRSITRLSEMSPTSSFVMRTMMSAIPSSPLQALLGSRGRSELDSSVRVVESLDQLYAQAAILFPILKHKVQQWATDSRGMFPVGHKAEHRYVLWSEVASADDETLKEQVRWAHLKGPHRAIEKLSRSYQGRVGHLLDVCRQSIVFECPATLAKCLSTIADDPDVSVCKVNNRLDKEYAARKSLGYRDVNLNIRIDTEATRRLGVDLHVCEVQMLLRPFAELKSNEGHKRYVAFRNARGK